MNSWHPFLSNSSGDLIPKPHITQMTTELKILGPRLSFAEMLEHRFGLAPARVDDSDEINEVDSIDDTAIVESDSADYVSDEPTVVDDIPKIEHVMAEATPTVRPCVYNPVVIDSRIFRHVKYIEEKLAQSNWAKKMRYIRPAQFVLTGIVFIPREITADGAII